MHNLGQAWASKEMYTNVHKCRIHVLRGCECSSSQTYVKTITCNSLCYIPNSAHQGTMLYNNIHVTCYICTSCAIWHAVWPHGIAAAGPSCNLAATECGACTGCTAFRFALSGPMSNIGCCPSSRSERHLQVTIWVCCSSQQKLNMQTAQTGSNLAMTTYNAVSRHSQADMRTAPGCADMQDPTALCEIQQR